MKKAALVISSIALLFASGCATKGYVKTQVDPVSDRIGGLEARMNAIESKLDQTTKDTESLKGQSQTDQAAIADMKAMAQKAEADAMRAGEDAKKAEEAAREAEKAAARAEKMFHLQQKK
jgi:chromosome segregation ATPase